MMKKIFNSLRETIYLLKSPANAAHLERSIAQFKQGKVVERDLLDDKKIERGKNYDNGDRI